MALADYNKAVELDPDDANVYNSRGSLHTSQEEYDLALKDFNKALEFKHPHYDDLYSGRHRRARSYNGRGSVYCAQHRYDLALADYNKALELDREDAAGTRSIWASSRA